jgi:phage shock protein A
MTNLFKKISTLVKATINDTLDVSSEPAVTRLDRRVEKDIKRLRQRINDAIAFEDELQGNIAALEVEIQQLDRQADEAVQSGNEDQARRAIQGLTHARRRLEMAGADLREHRLVTQELIRQVNAMEAAVADARRDEAAKSGSEPGAVSFERVNDVLAQAQEKLNRLRNRASTSLEQAPTHDPVQQGIDDAKVDADLESRRQRLSGPPGKR